MTPYVEQPPLAFDFPDVPRTRSTDPETSHMAAGDARAHAARDRDRVLACLREHGPLTDFELAAILGGQQTSLGKRRGELRDAGLVEYAGIPAPGTVGESGARVGGVAVVTAYDQGDVAHSDRHRRPDNERDYDPRDDAGTYDIIDGGICGLCGGSGDARFPDGTVSADPCPACEGWGRLP